MWCKYVFYYDNFVHLFIDSHISFSFSLCFFFDSFYSRHFVLCWRENVTLELHVIINNHTSLSFFLSHSVALSVALSMQRSFRSKCLFSLRLCWYVSLACCSCLFFSFKKSNFCILFVDVIELHTICDRTRDYYSSNAHTQTHISSYRSYWVLLTFVIPLDIYVYTLTLFLSRWPPSHFKSVVKFEIFVFVHT